MRLMTRCLRHAAAAAAAIVIAIMAFGGAAGALEVGDPAPDFQLPATTGGQISLSDFRGVKKVLIEFYHADWGPTCVANLTRRRDDYEQFSALNVEIVGISLNHTYSQAAFARSLQLPFPLLSDYPDGSTVQAYGVGYEEGKAHRLFARPSFFLIDEEGIIRGYWGQRPMGPDDALAPDPLVTSHPMLDMIRATFGPQ